MCLFAKIWVLCAIKSFLPEIFFCLGFSPMAFIYQHRVHFYETDGARIVHFSNYFRFMEMAETELYATFLNNEKGRDGTHGFPRVNAQCQYHAPLRFSDLVEISVSTKEIRTKSFTLSFKMHKKTAVASELVAEGEMSMVFVKFDFEKNAMQSSPLSDAFRAKLESLRD